jgi:transposase-like protein
LQKKSSPDSKPRIPLEANGIQVNFCKNPLCANFGVTASQSFAKGRSTQRDNYAVVAAGKNYPVLKCHACGEYPPLKSNTGIQEELTRLSAYLVPSPELCCPNSSCENSCVGMSTGKTQYTSFGKTKSGSKRYRCRACGKTFSVGVSTLRQKQPHKNRLVFSLLMNKMPLKRICEAAELQMPSVYAKIDFLRSQCLAFARHREQKLLKGMEIRRLYIGVDRQDYVVNWTKREDKRNVQLSAVGSADNESGYVFGMHLNFDSTLDATEIEADANNIGDCDSPYPFRRYARTWLACDYEKAAKNSSYYTSDGTLNGEVQAIYNEAMDREDVENFEHPTRASRLPANGMQIHAEYTLYAHFFLLKRFFGGAEKVRFFLDQDSGMRAACLGAFQSEIQDRRCDAFYVRINKSMTIDEKKKALARSRDEFRKMRDMYPDLSDKELKLLLIKERMQGMAEIGQWKDRWLRHPFPNMSEPEKAICYLTDYNDYDEDHQAWLYNKASLHAIDCFFMQVRRRLSLLERPFATASASRRIWHGYSAYNPESIVKLLDIFRVYYNYCLKGQDGKTPAMRLRLAKGAVSPEDIIYFAGSKDGRKRSQCARAVALSD